MMKKKIFTILASIAATAFFNAQNLSFKSKSFEKAILANELVNTNKDGSISQEEADQAENIFLAGKNLDSVEDLKLFRNAKMIVLDGNTLPFIDLNNLASVELFSCTECKTLSFRAENLPSLATLYLDKNQLAGIMLINTPKIDKLTIPFNKLKAIDLSSLPNLKELNIEYNQIEKLDISKNNKLKELNVKKNPLKESDIKKGSKTDVTIFGYQPQ